MSASTMSNAPAIPPRPSRSQEKPSAGSLAPTVPPRPTNRRNDRSVSPNPDRFAPSPFNDGLISPKTTAHGLSHLSSELPQNNGVGLPGPGEEGQEYALAIGKADSTADDAQLAATSNGQTRSVGEDIKLHAPKPTVPAQSATTRVATVTRTDSDRAASFGIGRPHSTDQQIPSQSLRKKASTASQLSQSSHVEDEHGIPHIGQHVPMYPNAGDVQAPSPAPAAASTEDLTRPTRHHTRKRSSRGFNELPPGSYGLHGHGVAPTDELDKAYYVKHPQLLQKEHLNYQHDRPTDYSKSSAELNKIVHDTASRGTGTGLSVGTPSEQVGYQAADEYVTRMSSPRRSSATPKDVHATSPLKTSEGGPEIAVDEAVADDDVIHVEDRNQRRGFVNYGDEDPALREEADRHYVAPILAYDEVAKDKSPWEQYAAVQPPPERSGSAFEMDEPKSRPTSRPASVYSQQPPEMHSTPLDDVVEYEPLFPENETGSKALSPQKLSEIRSRFPSRDIWEDAPGSVHATAEVSTPDVADAQSGRSIMDVPPREGETPAQAFARKQEELAEQEGRTPDGFLWRKQKAPSQTHTREQELAEQSGRASNDLLWSHKRALSQKATPSPNLGDHQSGHRFPSRDVWEDTPDSLQFTTTLSGKASGDDTTPLEGADSSNMAKPAIPARPRKQGSGDDVTSKPTIPERPKPKVPNRPSGSPNEAAERESAPKAKPAIPPRPTGNKIASLQAGFMSDLNKRLQLGPGAQKKEETSEPTDGEEKEKTPLPDARKGRARGPQRRAPTKAASGAASSPSAPPSTSHGKPQLSFSMTCTLWSIDEEGTMTVETPATAEGAKETAGEVEQSPDNAEVAPSADQKLSEPAAPGAEAGIAAHHIENTLDRAPEAETKETTSESEVVTEQIIEKTPSDEAAKVESGIGEALEKN